MFIRNAITADLESLAEVEAACFPAAEAASKDVLKERLAAYADHFWLLFDDDGRLVSFVDGMATDEPDLNDDMYADAGLHRRDGRWQMVFGVNTVPDCRRRGYAGLLLRRLIESSRERGRLGVVLTCKESLVPYYAAFGFRDEGISGSTHGHVVWHQMRLRF